MARKVFLSFLGISNYKEEGYYVNNDISTALEPMRFVQEAILLQYCQDFCSNDVAYIFLTDDAKRKNWADFEHIEDVCKGEKILKEGLEKRLSKMKLSFNVNPIPVDDGKSEEEIWKIFQQVYDCLETGDMLYFDITHGFRSSPMLTMTLINYAKVLKKINVAGIYYGAYEAGNRKEKLSPIWNLKSFSELQDWTIAANHFISFGNSNELSRLTKAIKADFLFENKKQKTRTTEKLMQFSKTVNQLTESISTVRGKEIIKATFVSDLKNILEDFKQVKIFAPLQQLLEKITQKTNLFQSNQITNGFIAVQWCLDSQLIQQGITFLQEFILTYLLAYQEQNEQLWDKKNYRDLMSGCLNVEKLEEFHFSTDDNNEEMSIQIEKKYVSIWINAPIVCESRAIYQTLSNQSRNDINHAGLSREKPLPAQDFRKILEKSLKKFEKIVENNPL